MLGSDDNTGDLLSSIIHIPPPALLGMVKDKLKLKDPEDSPWAYYPPYNDSMPASIRCGCQGFPRISPLILPGQNSRRINLTELGVSVTFKANGETEYYRVFVGQCPICKLIHWSIPDKLRALLEQGNDSYELSA